MLIPFYRLRVGALRELSLVLGLMVAAAGCAGARPTPEVPEPHPYTAPIEAPNEAAIDLIASVPAQPVATLSPARTAVTLPTRMRALEPDDVRAEFAHLFGDGDVDVPALVYPAIMQFVGVYSGRARESFATWLAREGRWGPLIREQLRLAGLPEDLVYLSLIESGFSNTAVSRARAVGMWQLMQPTARSLGLRIDEWVDERRDPQLATSAAIRHLRWLYEQTADWALAAAAYNTGLARVTRIQRDAGERDYFRLVAAGRLPQETRNYVPAILAASLIAHEPARFGFGDIEPEPPFQFDSIVVEPLTRLSAVARAAGATERELRELNPQLLQGATPPGIRYRVRVPHGIDPARTHQLLAQIPAAERLMPDGWMTIRYTVKRGDGWGIIAQRHHTTVAALKKQNPRVGAMLHPGMKLSIRVRRRGGSAQPAVATTQAASSVDTPTRPSKPASHTVAPGETMSGIARRYAVRLTDLARWNGMSRPRPVRIGERLRLTPPEPLRHKVAAGESLSGLARRYDVALSDLMKWNRISRPRELKIGEVLIVRAPG